MSNELKKFLCVTFISVINHLMFKYSNPGLLGTPSSILSVVFKYPYPSYYLLFNCLNSYCMKCQKYIKLDRVVNPHAPIS